MRLGSRKEDHEAHSRSCEGPWSLLSELKEVCASCRNVFVCTCVYVSVCIHVCVLCVYMCVFVYMCVCVKSLQLCPTLCGLMDCSPPGPSVYGILQARILEWVAISFSSLCIYLCAFTCIHLYIKACLCVFLYMCLWVCIYMHVHMYMFLYTCERRACLENPMDGGAW